MKQIMKIIKSPLLLVGLFSFLIINGQSSGFFYIIYVIMGISIAAAHSIFGLLGIGFLFAALAFPQQRKGAILSLLGILCLIVSLLSFFTQPGANYNYGTFTTPLPLALLILFFLIALFSIAAQLRYLLLGKNLS